LPQPSVTAAVRALRPGSINALRQSVEQLKATRGHLTKRLSDLNFVTRVWPSQANFVLARFADGPGFYEFARQRGVLLRNFGSQVGLENCLRVSCGSEADMSALEQVFSEYQA
jgi:histidinol-phosphate aminotransferase